MDRHALSHRSGEIREFYAIDFVDPVFMSVLLFL